MTRTAVSGAWFEIPGMQQGRRTLAEQMQGLAPALALAADKTVCDFGCAEGLIALEFARAGAKSVYACDFNAPLLEVAQGLAAKLPAGVVHPRFQQIDVRELIKSERESGEIWQYDIVLALAIIDKLPHPRELVEFCADVSREWVIYRLPEKSDGTDVLAKNGIGRVNVHKVMAAKGFNLDRIERGPRREAVHYWRRREHGA